MTAGRHGRQRVAVALLGAAIASSFSSSAHGAPADDELLDLALIDQDFAISADADWTARFRVDGGADQLEAVATTTTTTAPPAATAGSTTSTGVPTSTGTPAAASAEERATSAVVTVRVHGRILSRTTLEEAFAGDVGPPTDQLHLPLNDALTVAGDEATIDVVVPTSTEPDDTTLTLRLPGTYPVSIEVRADDVLLAEHLTFLDRIPTQPDDTPAMGVAVVAAVDDPGAAPSDHQLEATRSQLEALVALGSTTDAPLTVALPPTVETVLADDAELTSALRDALASSELLALPARQLDPSSAAAAGRAEAFSRELRAGEDALARLLPQSPTRRAAWLVTEPLSAAAAAQLRDPLGFRLLLLDEAMYSSLEGNISTFLDPTLSLDVALEGGGTLPATVLSPLGAALDGPAPSSEPTPAEAAVRVLSSLVTARRELGPELRRNVALATPGMGVPDAEVVSMLAHLATDSPDVTMTTISRFAGTDAMLVGDDRVTLRLPATAGVDLTSRAERIDLMRVAAVSAASMTTDGTRAAQWQQRLDAAFSTALDAAAADVAIDEVATEVDAVLASVQLPEPFTFTLTGRRSELRVNVRNSSEDQRVVIVRATSSRLRFPDGDQEVTLAPGVTEVLIPVEARGNGTSSVEIQLLTPVFGQRIGPSTFLTARVNALTGLGQVITGGALLVLITWWFSHLRSRRRSRLGTPAAGALDEHAVAVSPDAAEATAVSHLRETDIDDG